LRDDVYDRRGFFMAFILFRTGLGFRNHSPLPLWGGSGQAGGGRLAGREEIENILPEQPNWNVHGTCRSETNPSSDP